jgi:hypothetical protein
VRYASSNITTAVMFGFTVYLMVARFKSRQDWTWPLFYYLFLFVYFQAFPGSLNPLAVYAGVVCALLIRFEFLSKKVTTSLRVVEMGVLCYLAYAFLSLVAF